METTLQFEGKVTGQFELERSLAYAPKIFAKYYARGLSRERGGFVGDTRKKNQFGVFQRPLLNRKLWGGRVSHWGPTWSKQFLRHFRGKIYGGTDAAPLAGLTLELGTSRSSKLRPVTERLQSGGRSTGKMFIPVYHNLQKLGINPKTGSAGMWLRMRSAEHPMFFIHRGNLTLYFDKEIFQHNPHDALLFVRVRSVKVGQQYDFIGAWKKREPRAIERLRGDFDKAAQAINRGQFA